MAAVHLALTPRDGMFFKDGRGWATGSGERGHAVPWPFPSTLLGAVKTAWGRAVEAAQSRTFTSDDWRDRTSSIRLGAMLALRRLRGEGWSPDHRMWPVPADALYTETSRSAMRLEPIPRQITTLSRSSDRTREQLWRPDLPPGKPALAPAFWTESELVSWLSGKVVARLNPEDLATRSMPTRIDVRIGMDSESATVSEGALFVTETVETLQQTQDGLFEWGIGLEVHLPDGNSDLTPIFTLGSDRRLATWELLPDTIFHRPQDLNLRDAPGLRMIIISPACFAEGWRPDGFTAQGDEYRGQLPGVEADLILRAAFVPRPAHVSGWDMEKGRPKSTRRLAPAGSVYFFEKVDRAPFTADEMAGLWLRALGKQSDRDEGFGRVVAGPWEISR